MIAVEMEGRDDTVSGSVGKALRNTRISNAGNAPMVATIAENESASRAVAERCRIESRVRDEGRIPAAHRNRYPDMSNAVNLGV